MLARPVLYVIHIKNQTMEHFAPPLTRHHQAHKACVWISLKKPGFSPTPAQRTYEVEPEVEPRTHEWGLG